MDHLDAYFASARERYQITLNRRAGLPKPWTADPVYQEWKFCSVHREDDRTTAWFRDNIRDKLVSIDVIKATVAFRWFNRIETGERIKDLLLEPSYWDANLVRQRLAGVKPVVTGAYIILGAQGLPKLDGVLQCIDWAFDHIDKNWKDPRSLKEAWEWFSAGDIPYLGPFMSYEIVSDLRWTPVLDTAPDIMTWANAGPGCARGMGRCVDGDVRFYNVGSKADQWAMLDQMLVVLEASKSEEYWPQEWPHWEMREVEHWSCEFDKKMRIIEGGRMKNKYPGR